MIRVLVKASSAIARAGLESLIREHPGFQLIAGQPGGASVDGPEPLPDVLVAEAESFADDSAREALDWANAGGPVVLLVRNLASESIAEGLRDGVKAVLPAGLTAAEIVAAIEAAAAGLVVLDGIGAEGLVHSAAPVSGGDVKPLIEALTPREIEVLRLVAVGLGNREVASRLKISEHTVKFHVASLMGKLGAASRTEAVTLGIRHGLILI
ncbi:MAG: response regulator transcription factor [Acidobacteria bacterium]|nr:MAG: response regulator transcription factor [Acidobacteriota bacterium]